MTHNQLLTMLTAIAGRNADDTNHTTQMRHAIRLALGQGSRVSSRLAGHEVDLKMTLVAGTIRYALPTTDIDSNVITLAAWQTGSFRTKTRESISWVDPTKLDKLDPDWLDSSLQDSGTIEAIAYSGHRLCVYKPASAAFVTDNPALYFRGWRQIKKPSADGLAAGSGEVEWAAEIDFPWDDWHDGFLHGALYWTFQAARQPEAAQDILANKWRPFLSELSNLNPVEPSGDSQLSPSRHFVDGGSEDDTADDYGSRWLAA